MRQDWALIKDEIMIKALQAKFAQNEHLKRELIGTGDKILIEHTLRDSYWGDGGYGSGLNKLFQLLMQVRSEFNEHPKIHKTSINRK